MCEIIVQVNSDEAGAGFAEVGALSEAKDALREAVQLPLQHPRLFQKGSLARWGYFDRLAQAVVRTQPCYITFVLFCQRATQRWHWLRYVEQIMSKRG